jgi:hypothetical protein
MRRLTWIPPAALVACLGCAGQDSRPIQTLEEDRRATGFRYYESSPYILVYSDGKSLKSDLIYLPDRNRKMSIEFFDFLSTNTAKLTFSNGVLTSSDVESDSTIIPKAVVEAAKQAAVAAAKGGAFSTVDKNVFKVPPPYLFKFIVHGAKTKLVAGSYVSGGKPLELEIEVNVPKGDQ